MSRSTTTRDIWRIDFRTAERLRWPAFGEKQWSAILEEDVAAAAAGASARCEPALVDPHRFCLA